MSERWSRNVKRLVLLVACTWAIAGCSVYNGPFDGRIIDPAGKPIPGAFVGFVWSGEVNTWSPMPGCLHAVLVRTDSNGRYSVPKQALGISFLQRVMRKVSWSQEAWAPGYLLAASEQASGVDLRLLPAKSTTEALQQDHRMEPREFSCAADKNTLADLAKARYADSFKRICRDQPPAEALEQDYALIPSRDLLATGAPRRATQEEWREFNRKAGWSAPPEKPGAKIPALSADLLPELCRLSSGEQYNEEKTP